MALLAAAADARLRLEGRWLLDSSSARADWPCSAVSFVIRAEQPGATLRVSWAGVRTRINASVASDGRPLQSTIWKGSDVFRPFASPLQNELRVPSGVSLVRLRKLNSATPYSTGIASRFFHPSIFEFRGLEIISGSAFITSNHTLPVRRIEVIGASDSAGWCVDGTPTTAGIEEDILGWEYSDCDGAAGPELARRMGASISVQALAGSGLTQNANSRRRWEMGSLTMADLYNRTLQTDPSSYWNVSAHTPPQVCSRLLESVLPMPTGYEINL